MENHGNMLFFVDVLFKDFRLFQEVTQVLEKAVKELKIIGIYKNNLDHIPSQLINTILNEK